MVMTVEAFLHRRSPRVNGAVHVGVAKPAVNVLVTGMEAASTEVVKRVANRLLGRAFRLIPLLGIPLGASVNISSTLLVGGQARSYFMACDGRP